MLSGRKLTGKSTLTSLKSSLRCSRTRSWLNWAQNSEVKIILKSWAQNSKVIITKSYECKQSSNCFLNLPNLKDHRYVRKCTVWLWRAKSASSGLHTNVIKVPITPVSGRTQQSTRLSFDPCLRRPGASANRPKPSLDLFINNRTISGI